MVAITATQAAVITPDWSTKVPSPAYDSMTPDQRRTIREQNPWSFLNVTLSPEDISADGDVPNEKLIALARDSLDQILAANAFESDLECLYIYRLHRDGHTQTAIVADIDLADYESGQIKIHEKIKQQRAELLAEHLQSLGVLSSPIALTYRNNPDLTELMQRCTTDLPLVTIEAQFGVVQTIWRLTDAKVITEFKTAFSDKTLYIIDGHHRAAATLAASKLYKTNQSKQLFGALFPHNELKLLGFNRWIKPSVVRAAITSDTLLERYNAKRLSGYKPAEKGEAVIYIGKHWLSILFEQSKSTDASELQTQILQPIFSIDPADQSSIENLAGNQPHQNLCDLVDKNGGVGVFLAPLKIEEFLAIADSEELLPPKSTYFTPKIQSGVFLRFIS